MKSTDEYSFRVSIETHDKTAQVVAAYFQVRKGKVKVAKEYADGNAFADYDSRGKLLGIELLAPCRASVLDGIAAPAPAKRFVQGAVPQGMLVTV